MGRVIWRRNDAHSSIPHSLWKCIIDFQNQKKKGGRRKWGKGFRNEHARVQAAVCFSVNKCRGRMSD